MPNGLSIIIVTYNPGEELLDCIRSIGRAVTCEHEIILVDNSEQRPEIFSRFEGPIILRDGRNKGFSTANNIGVEASRHEIILFLNPDTTLEKFPADPASLFVGGNVGILSGICRGEDGAYKRTAGIFPTNPVNLISFSRRLDRRDVILSGRFGNEAIPVDYTEGSLYLVQRRVFLDCGGFDSTIFLYGEDYELSYRIACAGNINYISPQVEYKHIGGFNDSREPYIVNGLIYFYSKHLSIPKQMALRGILSARYLALLAKSCIGALSAGARGATYRRRITPLTRSLKRCLVK